MNKYVKSIIFIVSGCLLFGLGHFIGSRNNLDNFNSNYKIDLPAKVLYKGAIFEDAKFNMLNNDTLEITAYITYETTDNFKSYLEADEINNIFDATVEACITTIDDESMSGIVENPNIKIDFKNPKKLSIKFKIENVDESITDNKISTIQVNFIFNDDADDIFIASVIFDNSQIG